MPRFSAYRLAQDVRERLREELFRLIAGLKSLDEVRAAFRDVATPTELLSFMRRIHVASALLKGSSYHEIKKAVRVSRSLIHSVARKLAKDGSGFEILAGRLGEIQAELRDEIGVAIGRTDPHSLESHMKRFAGYYMGVHLARAAPKLARNAIAARSRRRSLRRKKS